MCEEYARRNKAKDMACESQSFHLCSSLEKGCLPHFPQVSLFIFTLGASFCCTRIKLLVPHFPIGKGGVPKMQKTRAYESPGFLD